MEPDFIIIDDLDDEAETPQTKAERDRIIQEWFDAELRSRLQGHTVILLGTRL